MFGGYSCGAGTPSISIKVLSLSLKEPQFRLEGMFVSVGDVSVEDEVVMIVEW
jgi:hypothetical protein